MDPLIKLENITRTYKKGENVVYALDGINEEIYKSEFISIIGRSGSGKSTLLNLLGGLDQPSSGKMFFKDKNLAEFNHKQLANYRKFQVGMIFQSFNLIQSFSALENVKLALTFGGMAREERKKTAARLLGQLGLENRLNHKPDELSGGEAQRVAIARALANKPEIILADEPTGNLDSITSGEIIDLLTQLNKNQGITIILVTHDQDIATTKSDRVIRLVDGKTVDNKTLTL